MNPAAPQVLGARIVFPTAGEYYFTIDDKWSFKVLVLAAGEPVSSAVNRIFDFWVANCVFSTNDEDAYYADRAGYLDGFFRRTGHMILLSGPTHWPMARLVGDEHALLTRRGTLSGTFR